MKYINSLLGMSLLLLLIIAGCKKDDYTGASTITPKNPTAVLDIADVPTSMVEADVEMLYSITLSEPQIVDVSFNVQQIGGDAIEGTDFTIDHSVYIPAYKTVGYGTIIIHSDYEFEETETIKLQIGDAVTPNVNFTSQTVDIELKNYVDAGLTVTFDWAGSAVVNEVESPFCGNVDLDMFLYDADGELSAYAATADCPEVMLTPDLADGDYDLVVNLWYNALHDTINPQLLSFPITVSYEQKGSLLTGSFKQTNTANMINSDDLDYYDDPDDVGALKTFGRINVTNDVYSVEEL